MNIEIAAICDAATANDIGGRMNILGAFDRIFAKFPLVIPQCSAAFRLRYQRSEAGAHQLNLSIEDVVGHPIVPPMHLERAAATLACQLCQNAALRSFVGFASSG